MYCIRRVRPVATFALEEQFLRHRRKRAAANLIEYDGQLLKPIPG